MTGAVIIDSNIAVLLIVGTASRSFITKHKRLRGYCIEDFELVGEILKEFSDIITLPHVLSETSSLVRQIFPGAYGVVHDSFQAFVEGAVELNLPSREG